jgi:hypothetical protein
MQGDTKSIELITKLTSNQVKAPKPSTKFTKESEKRPIDWKEYSEKLIQQPELNLEPLLYNPSLEQKDILDIIIRWCKEQKKEENEFLELVSIVYAYYQ